MLIPISFRLYGGNCIRLKGYREDLFTYHQKCEWLELCEKYDKRIQGFENAMSPDNLRRFREIIQQHNKCIDIHLIKCARGLI